MLLSLIATLGLALRLYRIDAASFWSDELFSVFWIQNSLGFISIDGLEIETTPPLYYLLLKPWVAVFGSSEFGIRSLSAALSAATIPVVYLLAAQFKGPAVGLLAAALFAFMPMQVHFGQEARAYALLPLLYGVAILSLTGLLRKSGHLAYSVAGQYRWLAAYGTAAVLLVYSHATSAFTLAALGLCMAVALTMLPTGHKVFLRLVAVNLLVVALAIPEIRAMLVQSSRFDMQWVESPTMVSLMGAAASFLVDPSTPLTLFRIASILAVALGGGLLLLLLPLRPGRLASLFFIGTPMLFLAATLLISFYSPFFLPRITVWIGVPFCILAAMVLLAPLPRWRRLGFAVALVCAWGVGLQGVYGRSMAAKEDWRGVASVLRSQLAPGDLMLIGPNTNLRGLAYYIGTELIQSRWRPTPAPIHPLLFLPRGMLPPPVISSAELGDLVQQGRPVWLVLKQKDWEDWGDAAMSAAGRSPEVNRDYPMLTLLRWPSPPVPLR